MTKRWLFLSLGIRIKLYTVAAPFCSAKTLGENPFISASSDDPQNALVVTFHVPAV
jgi:hypothetical protein